MKMTGIIRRIDDLGRIVIPKEFRRLLRIDEYDPLEIFSSPDGGIILKKYYPLSNLGKHIPAYAETLHYVLGCDSLICDKETVMAAAGPNSKGCIGKKIHPDIKDAILEGKNVFRNQREHYTIAYDFEFNEYATQVIAPVYFNEDPYGAVILLLPHASPDTLTLHMKMAIMISHLIGVTIEY